MALLIYDAAEQRRGEERTRRRGLSDSAVLAAAPGGRVGGPG